GDLDKEISRWLVQRTQLLAKPASSTQQLSIDVELPLVPGPVADPDRPALAPARHVPQLPLRQIVLTADSEHDLEVHPADTRRGSARHPGKEAVGLVRAGGYPERLQRQARVADPCEPVVPVASGAHSLRQGGGGRRHDGTRRLEGQGLQHATAVVNQLSPRPLISL